MNSDVSAGHDAVHEKHHDPLQQETSNSMGLRNDFLCPRVIVAPVASPSSMLVGANLGVANHTPQVENWMNIMIDKIHGHTSWTKVFLRGRCRHQSESLGWNGGLEGESSYSARDTRDDSSRYTSPVKQL